MDRLKNLFSDKDTFTRNKDMFKQNETMFKDDRTLFTGNRDIFTDDKTLFTSKVNEFSKNKNTFADKKNIFSSSATTVRNEYWVLGHKQSPVDVPYFCTKDSGVKGLKVTFNDGKHTVLHNTGCSAKIQMASSDNEMTGGPLGSTRYILEQFHFHWGSTEGKGGEHTIHGNAFDAELHFVCFNSLYLRYEDASKELDGLAVLGILIKVGETPHAGMEQITSNLRHVSGESTSFKLPCALKCMNLFPSNTEDYYTYNGSLTTPPYTENVTWIIYQEPIYISKKQMNAFRNLKDDKGYHIRDNYRATQAIGGRVVKSSF